MRLSQAIRAGAKLSGQVFGKFVDCHGVSNEVTNTCALGAAAHALGFFDSPQNAYNKICDYFTEIRTTSDVICPCRCPESRQWCRTFDIVEHLNDEHQWSREAISEWVGTIEDKLEAQNADPVVQAPQELCADNLSDRR